MEKEHSNYFGIKVKIHLFLRLIKHHVLNTYGRVEIQLHAVLTWALVRLHGAAAGTHRLGGWMSPTAALGTGGERSQPLGGIDPRPSNCLTYVPSSGKSTYIVWQMAGFIALEWWNSPLDFTAALGMNYSDSEASSLLCVIRALNPILF
jgi:hypothetical protein